MRGEFRGWVAETTQIDDSLDTRLAGGVDEILCCLPILLLKISRRTYRMHNVIGSVHAGHGRHKCAAIQAVTGYNLGSGAHSCLQEVRAAGKATNRPATRLQGLQQPATNVAYAAG